MTSFTHSVFNSVYLSVKPSITFWQPITNTNLYQNQTYIRNRPTNYQLTPHQHK